MSNAPDTVQQKLIRRTLTDYLLYFPAVAISGVMGLVTVAVLSKFFSPAAYGHYTLALSTLLFLSMVTALWLRSSVLRLLPQYMAQNQSRAFIGTMLAAGSLVTVAVVAGYALVLVRLHPHLDAGLYRLLWLVVPGVPLLTMFTVLQETHRIRGRAAWYSGLVLWRVLGGFGVGLWLAVRLKWGPAGMVAGLLLVIGGAVAGHGLAAMPRLPATARQLRYATPILRDMLAFSLPIVGLNLASTVLAVSDRYLIEAFLSSYDLGIYAATYSLAEGGMRLIANTFLIATQPTIFRVWVSAGGEAACRLVERLFRYYLLLALPALVGLSVLNRRIVTLFTTPEYAAGAEAMVYVSLALFLHGYSLLVGTIFDAAKRTMIPFVTFVLAGAMNILLNLLLLPRFGYMAAAWSTCAGYAFLLGLNLLAVRRITPLHGAGRYVWKIGLAAMGMGGVVWLAQNWFPLSMGGLAATVALGVVTYVLLALAGGVFRREEQLYLQKIAGRLIEPLRTDHKPA